jgi:hypothetical protein
MTTDQDLLGFIPEISLKILCALKDYMLVTIPRLLNVAICMEASLCKFN